MGNSEKIVVHDHFLNPSTYANLLLCGSAAYAMSEISYSKTPFAFASSCLLFGHGFIGTMAHNFPELKCHERIQELYKYTSLLTRSISMPLLNAQLGEMHSMGDIYVQTSLGSGVVPIGQDTANRMGAELPANSDQVADFVALGNATAMGFMGLSKNDFKAVGLAIYQTFCRFGLNRIVDKFEMQKIEPQTLGLCGMAIFMSVIFKEESELKALFKELLNTIKGQ